MCNDSKEGQQPMPALHSCSVLASSDTEAVGHVAAGLGAVLVLTYRSVARSGFVLKKYI